MSKLGFNIDYFCKYDRKTDTDIMTHLQLPQKEAANQLLPGSCFSNRVSLVSTKFVWKASDGLQPDLPVVSQFPSTRAVLRRGWSHFPRWRIRSDDLAEPQ